MPEGIATEPVVEAESKTEQVQRLTDIKNEPKEVREDSLIPSEDYRTSPLFYEVANYFGIPQSDWDNAKNELSQLLTPEIVETPLGRLVVRGIFNTTKNEVICGGEVTKGKLSIPALAKVMRAGKELAEVEVTNLKRGPQDTHEINEGEMGGVSLATSSKLDLKEGDHLEVFTRKTVTRTI